MGTGDQLSGRTGKGAPYAGGGAFGPNNKAQRQASGRWMRKQAGPGNHRCGLSKENQPARQRAGQLRSRGSGARRFGHGEGA